MSEDYTNGAGDSGLDMTAVDDAEFGQLSAADDNAPAAAAERRRNLEALYAVPLTVTVQLGETEMTIRDLLSLSPGSVLELDRLAGESVDLHVNGVYVGSGDAVVVNGNYGLRITSVLSPAERLAHL